MTASALIKAKNQPHIHEVSTTVISHHDVASGYRLLELDAPAITLDCQPGQFFHILCPVQGELHPFLRRPMSIYHYNQAQGLLAFLYKVTGTGTQALSHLHPGDSLNIVGPLGKGFHIPHNAQHLLLVARGVGLATLAPLAQEAQRLERRLTAICSARSPEHLMSIEHFKELGAEVIPVTDSNGNSNPATLELLIHELITNEGVDQLYTCGSNRLLKLLQRLGRKTGVTGQIALEQQMACGIGMCQCCVRSFRREGAIVQERVCREGPVFDMQEAMGW